MQALRGGLWVRIGILSSLSFASATTLTVINTNAGGAGSLRQAILDANAGAGSDTIVFAIPGSGNFCPSTTVTRGQMAVFLVTTFGLTQPAPSLISVSFSLPEERSSRRGRGVLESLRP